MNNYKKKARATRALIEAIRNSDAETFEQAIKEGANFQTAIRIPFEKYEYHTSALITAIDWLNVTALRRLIQLGADPLYELPHGESARDMVSVTPDVFYWTEETYSKYYEIAAIIKQAILDQITQAKPIGTSKIAVL